MEINVVSGDITQQPAAAIVVNLFEGVTVPGGATGAVDRSLDGAVSSLISEGEIKGKGASIWLRLPILVVPPAGAVASGHPIAAVGVGVATLITAIVLPKGRNISLAAGSVVGMRLDRDLTISLAVSPDYE